MAHTPNEPRWYLAEIVEEIKIEDENTSTVHLNLVLVRANSPQEAFDRSLELGKKAEVSYKNTDGKHVTSIIRGLHDLNLIWDELEHGAEIIYERFDEVTEERIQALVKPKERLGIFIPPADED